MRIPKQFFVPVDTFKWGELSSMPEWHVNVVTVFKSRKASHLFFDFLNFFSSLRHWAAGTNSSLLLELLTGWLVYVFEDEGTCRAWPRRRIPYHTMLLLHDTGPARMPRESVWATLEEL
jgi:hypothetical protein